MPVMAEMFPTAGKLRTGYDRDQVEDFFERARASYESEHPGDGRAHDADEVVDEHTVARCSFDLVRGGYLTSSVDSALDRLQTAFIQRRRTSYISEHGEAKWMEEIAERATTLYPRLLRPAGERFRAPERGRGYDREEVDAVLDRLTRYFDRDGHLSADELRTATFTSVRRSRGYHEGTVDAYLARAVEVLAAVE